MRLLANHLNGEREGGGEGVDKRPGGVVLIIFFSLLVYWKQQGNRGK